MFEATPLEIATAYTIFPNQGHDAAAASTSSHRERRRRRHEAAEAATATVARPDTTYLVTNMMRSVLNEGTGAGARDGRLHARAAGKTGTTNDLRDAWFVGFTPELLTVVWVGFDDNQPRRSERCSGGAADLDTVHDACAGRHAPACHSRCRRGSAFAEIDRDTGKLATPLPHVIHEAFLAGTEPTRACELHASDSAETVAGRGG